MSDFNICKSHSVVHRACEMFFLSDRFIILIAFLFSSLPYFSIYFIEFIDWAELEDGFVLSEDVLLDISVRRQTTQLDVRKPGALRVVVSVDRFCCVF